MILSPERQNEIAISAAAELVNLEFMPEAGEERLFAPAPGSARVFVDHLIDAVITNGPAIWPVLLSGLTAASLLIPGLKSLVVILQTVPADKILDILKQIRTII